VLFKELMVGEIVFYDSFYILGKRYDKLNTGALAVLHKKVGSSY
jgi:hypothetical protein